MVSGESRGFVFAVTVAPEEDLDDDFTDDDDDEEEDEEEEEEGLLEEEEVAEGAATARGEKGLVVEVTRLKSPNRDLKLFAA